VQYGAKRGGPEGGRREGTFWQWGSEQRINTKGGEKRTKKPELLKILVISFHRPMPQEWESGPGKVLIRVGLLGKGEDRFGVKWVLLEGERRRGGGKLTKEDKKDIEMGEEH